MRSLFHMKKKLIDEEKPFRRVDGNHRLQAMEQLVSTGQISSTYLIPFCLILFADTDSLKDEKVIFHNINSKAVPLKSEQLLKSVLIQQHDGLDFNDRELIEKIWARVSSCKENIECQSSYC